MSLFLPTKFPAEALLSVVQITEESFWRRQDDRVPPESFFLFSSFEVAVVGLLVGGLPNPPSKIEICQ